MYLCYLENETMPAHCTYDTIEMLCCTTPDFIVVMSRMWPPSSPDLNAVDYAIWSVILQCANESRVHDIDELWQCLLHVWHGLEQSLIDDTVDQWPIRLNVYVNASSGHFEYALWLWMCFFCTWYVNFMFHIMLDIAGNIVLVSNNERLTCDQKLVETSLIYHMESKQNRICY